MVEKSEDRPHLAFCLVKDSQPRQEPFVGGFGLAMETLSCRLAKLLLELREASILVYPPQWS